MDEHPFGLEDSAFWGDTGQALDAFRSARMSQRKDEILIDGPARVAWDVKQSAPVCAYYGGSLRTLIAHRFSRCAAITAVRLETNTTFAGRALPAGGIEPQPDEDDPGSVVGSELYNLDLRRSLGIR